MSSEDVLESSLKVPCVWKCGVCSGVCPREAVIYGPGGVTIDGALCSKCLVCVSACPAGIIGEERFA